LKNSFGTWVYSLSKMWTCESDYLHTCSDDIHINWKNEEWMKGTLKWLELKYSPSDIKSLEGMIYKGLKVKNKLIFSFMKALCVATNHQWYSDWEISFFICLRWLFLHFNLRNVWFYWPSVILNFLQYIATSIFYRLSYIS